MPHNLYLVRLIHYQTRRAFPGERLWIAAQLSHPATIRFLRVRNREGCDVGVHPYTEERNPDYILVDLDRTDPAVVESMRAAGHEPCVVLQTSPGNLQAWVQVSATPIEAAVASQIGKQLAHLDGGDLASRSGSLKRRAFIERTWGESRRRAGTRHCGTLSGSR